MRAMLFPIMVVLAVVFAFIAWQSLHERKAAQDMSAGLLNQRIAARFGAFDTLDSAIQKYTANHNGQIPSSIDDAIKSSPELFIADVVAHDAAVNHNLSETILRSNVDFQGPGNGNRFQYQWAILLFVPRATMPEGFARTTDYIRWSGQTSSPGNWAGGFTSTSEAGQYFSADIINAARAKVEGESAATTSPATRADIK